MALEIFYKLCEEEKLPDACQPCEICPYYYDCIIITDREDDKEEEVQ